MIEKIRAAALDVVLVIGFAGLATPAYGEAGDILVRIRGIGVIPTGTGDSSGIGPDLVTSGLEAEPAITGEVDITYMITDNIGAELIAATPFHEIEMTGALSNLGDVARAWLLPPTLTLQYHFLPKGKVRPYVGVGINYTHFFLEDARAPLEAAIGPTHVTLSDSVGWAVQAGVDFALDENIFINFDFKYVDIRTEATLSSPGITRTHDVNINPVIVGVGIGYRF